jgi:DNA gyrase subunit A
LILSLSKEGEVKVRLRTSISAFKDHLLTESIIYTGKAGARLKGDDIVEDVLSVNNHDHLLFFSEGGSAYSLRAFQVPEAARTSLGTAMPQILPVTKSNPIAALLPVSSFENEDLHLVMLTNNGLIKRTPLKQFAKINTRGIQAIKIKEEDKLQFVALCTESDSILLTASNGMALHFSASKLRPQGRMAAGVRSMAVPPESGLVSLTVLESGLAQEEDSDAVDDEDGLSDGPPSTTTGPWFLTVTSSGFGKLTPVGDFKIRQSRIGRGLKAIRLTGTDRVVATAVVVDKDDSLLISTKNGAIVRLCLQNISVYSRTAKGTRVVKLKGDDEVVAATVSPAGGELV